MKTEIRYESWKDAYVDVLNYLDVENNPQRFVRIMRELAKTESNDVKLFVLSFVGLHGYVAEVLC